MKFTNSPLQCCSLKEQQKENVVALSIPDEVQCKYEEDTERFSLDFPAGFCADKEK